MKRIDQLDPNFRVDGVIPGDYSLFDQFLYVYLFLDDYLLLLGRVQHILFHSHSFLALLFLVVRFTAFWLFSPVYFRWQRARRRFRGQLAFVPSA